MVKKTFQAAMVILIMVLLLGSVVHSLPLSTRSRWIVDAATGRRVKLTCVNWAAHMEAVLAEGLEKKPLGFIASEVASLGFNCVRLTWATHMFTRPNYANLTVAKSLDSLNLTEAKVGVAMNNPFLLDLSVIEAYEAVVDALGEKGVMVVLDNHVSKPQWCCSEKDGNGFFGDVLFDPEEWLRGLTAVAKLFKGKPQVVAMSMRNELRGPRQNEADWYRFVPRGARTIHEINPDVLVLVSGFNYGTDLSFLRKRPLGVKLDKKLVFEAHTYSSGDHQGWEEQPFSQVCDKLVKGFDRRVGFVVQGENPVPLFFSEFGVDQRGVNRVDNRFLSCFLAYAAERDLDWAIWALQGSYYLRNGSVGFQETYGVLDKSWEHTQNPKFEQRFGLIHEMLQDPMSSVGAYYVIYHPQSGLCVQVKWFDGVHASDCQSRSRWTHAGDGAPIMLMNTALCLKAVGDGLPVSLSTDCSSEQSAWTLASSSKLQMAAVDEQGTSLCMKINDLNHSEILTMKCDSDSLENQQTQWFKLIPSNLT